jgi:hypothetical protein
MHKYVITMQHINCHNKHEYSLLLVNGGETLNSLLIELLIKKENSFLT